MKYQLRRLGTIFTEEELEGLYNDLSTLHGMEGSYSEWKDRVLRTGVFVVLNGE